MSSYTIIPNKDIGDKGPTSRAFLEKGITNFHDACEYVLRLPYARTSDTVDWLHVLSEGRGVCSSKHALIASLAEELKLDVRLFIGVYPMKEANTPGVGKVLNDSPYEFVPEAHCYIKYQDQRVDLTGLPHGDVEPINEIIVEEAIVPAQTSNYKRNFHRDYMKNWAGPEKFEEAWVVREACIEALSKGN